MVQMLPTQNVGAKRNVTPSTPAASKLRADHLAARRTAIGLAIKLVEGNSVTDAAILKARQAADMSAAGFAEVLDTLAERKAAVDAFESRDFVAERADNITARKDAQAEVDRIDKELAQLREQSREAHERLTSLVNHGANLQRQQADALNAKTSTLAKTGDRGDWRLIQ